MKADQDMVGTLGAQVMAEAILRAVRSAESAYGLVGAKICKNSEKERLPGKALPI